MPPCPPCRERSRIRAAAAPRHQATASRAPTGMLPCRTCKCREQSHVQVVILRTILRRTRPRPRGTRASCGRAARSRRRLRATRASWAPAPVESPQSRQHRPGTRASLAGMRLLELRRTAAIQSWQHRCDHPLDPEPPPHPLPIRTLGCRSARGASIPRRAWVGGYLLRLLQSRMVFYS